MSSVADRLRTPRERVYKILLYFFGVAIWLIYFVTFVAAALNGDAKDFALIFAYVVFFVLFLFVSAGLFRARAFGNMILLGPSQCATLYDAVVAGARELDMAKVPRTFIYNSNGVMNAFARRLLGGRYVFLTSALMEVQDDAQIRFVIGHELGHHAAGHLDPLPAVIKFPGHFVPFLGPAYSRARERTCDNIGAFLCRDDEAARTALQNLACGCRRLNGTLNCDAFAAQEQLVPGVFGWLHEIISSHPRLTRRVLAISATHEQRMRDTV